MSMRQSMSASCKAISAGCMVVAMAVGGLAAGSAAAAEPVASTTVATTLGFEALVERLKGAIQANKMGLVTQACASCGAAKRGVTIPGNMVLGVYRNDFAVRMLEASVASGIEAPIRFYVTEGDDGTASLTYRLPSAVFAPYGNAELDAMATEMDAIWTDIIAATTN
jgi:uncharacterized protein (DUF302 family)